MTDITRSIVRAVTPIAIGFGISLLAHFHITSPDAVAAIGSVAAAVYASGLRLIEQRHPKAGKMLGAMKVK